MRPGIIDARARYRSEDRRLGNSALDYISFHTGVTWLTARCGGGQNRPRGLVTQQTSQVSKRGEDWLEPVLNTLQRTGDADLRF